MPEQAPPASVASGSERLFVKICGITRVEDALAAVAAGADALGFVFWPGSPRAITPAAAARIGREVPPFVARVGVFVDAPLQELRDAADVAGLDVLQLHGPLSPDACAGLPRRVLKALSVGPEFRAEDAAAYASHAAGVLLDTYSRTSPGGTGVAFDWTRARGLRARLPFLLLAGGLGPENVADAVATVQPHGVDVSSGVETSPGLKDHAKLRAFVAAARGAPSRAVAQEVSS